MCRSKSYNSQKSRFGRPRIRSWRITFCEIISESCSCVASRQPYYFCCHASRAPAHNLPQRWPSAFKLISRPEFARANFGIKFVSLDTGKVLYSLNSNKLFVPASTTKLLTEGTVLAKLGADYRFHTRIYRTAPVDKKGKLKGDLILVASGDPNLSNRIRPHGTLAFVDEHHSYNAPAVARDPLAVLKQLAKDIAAKGLRKIETRLLIDT